MRTFGALDARLFTDAAYPLVGARRCVPRLAARPALESPRVNVGAPSEERPEERNLLGRRGVRVDRCWITTHRHSCVGRSRMWSQRIGPHSEQPNGHAHRRMQGAPLHARRAQSGRMSSRSTNASGYKTLRPSGWAGARIIAGPTDAPDRGEKISGTLDGHLVGRPSNKQDRRAPRAATQSSPGCAHRLCRPTGNPAVRCSSTADSSAPQCRSRRSRQIAVEADDVTIPAPGAFRVEISLTWGRRHLRGGGIGFESIFEEPTCPEQA